MWDFWASKYLMLMLVIYSSWNFSENVLYIAEGSMI